MPRIAQHLGRIADLNDPPRFQHRDAFGHRRGRGKIVGHEQQRQSALALQCRQQHEDFATMMRVQRRHRLVADQQLRIAGQRAGNGDALALAAGELVRVSHGHVGIEADCHQQFAGFSEPRCRIADAVDPQRFAHDVANAHARIQRRIRILEHHADAFAHRAQRGAVQCGQLDIVQPHPTLRAAQQAQHRAAEGALAAAAFAQQREAFAAMQGERDIVQRGRRRARVLHAHGFGP